MENFIEEIIRGLNPVEHSNLILKEILRYMKNLGREKKLLIIDPLDRNKRFDVL
jgi:hypothetical protein